MGKRIAGGRSGGKGALLGIGAAMLARRSVPALAAVAAAGWGYNKWRERKARRGATFPTDATPL
ncbi:MAG: hypothetical protein ABIS23_04190 [Sphingomicrobium sp.]